MTNDMRVIVEFAALSLSLSPSPPRRVAVLVSHISKLKALMGFRSGREFFYIFFFLFSFSFWRWEMGVDGSVFRLCTFSL